MFRKLFLTAALTATAALAAPATGRAQGDQEWKLGVVISGGGDRGCVLNQVIDGSPAQDIGLEPGDTLLTVNGQLASDPLAVRSTIFANDSVVLVLKRGNSHFQKNVTFEVLGGNQANNGGPVVTTAVAAKAVKSVKTFAVAAPNMANAKPLAKPPVSPKPAVNPTPTPKPVPHPPTKPVTHPAPKTSPQVNR